MHVAIFEDDLIAHFSPLVQFRPVYALRCGAQTLLEKILRQCPNVSYSLLMRPHLATLVREFHPQVAINLLPESACWLVNGRVLASPDLGKLLRKRHVQSHVYRSGSDLVAVFLSSSDATRLGSRLNDGRIDHSLLDEFASSEIDADCVRYPWDCISHSGEQIVRDVQTMKSGRRIQGKIHYGAHVLNRKHIFIGKGSVLKPGAVVDAEHGPVVIGDNVTIMPHSYIEGPAYIGDHSTVKAGARLTHGTSIGVHCKVGGEVEASIIQSYSNKQHDGFLGHSMVGSWVNIGADTNTSDLKNTYGTVRVELNGNIVDSQELFVGLTIGDHSKTGINVMFDAGTIVGVCCNIYGAGLPPRAIPAFSWGSSSKLEEYDLEKCIATAKLVMARRGVTMTNAYEQLIRNAFAGTTEDRRRSGVR